MSCFPTVGGWYFRTIQIDENILGNRMKGYLPIKLTGRVYTPEEITYDKGLILKAGLNYWADRILDFASLRQKIKAENTDLGEKMIQKWMPALEKLKSSQRKPKSTSL